jgi:hypothetical protein
MCALVLEPLAREVSESSPNRTLLLDGEKIVLPTAGPYVFREVDPGLQELETVPLSKDKKASTLDFCRQTKRSGIGQ